MYMTSIQKISRCSMRSLACRSRGFGMSAALILMMTGSIALSFVVLGAAISYSESVNKRIERIQAAFNERACNDAISLIRLKNVFASGWIEIPELGCRKLID